MELFKIPRLETERLILRAFCEETDFEAYASFYASDRTRYYGGPLDRQGAWRAAAAMMGHWIIRGYGNWAVEEKATGDFCGLVGLWYPEGWPEAEVGWSMIEEKGGKGFATEAAIRARDYAYDTLGWDRLVSCIDPDNASSIRLAERLGATLDYEAQHPTRDRFLVYAHPAPGEIAG